MKLILGGNRPKPYRDIEDEPIVCPQCGSSVFSVVVCNPRRKKLTWLKNSGEKKLMCITCKEVCG